MNSSPRKRKQRTDLKLGFLPGLVTMRRRAWNNRLSPSPRFLLFLYFLLNQWNDCLSSLCVLLGPSQLLAQSSCRSSIQLWFRSVKPSCYGRSVWRSQFREDAIWARSKNVTQSYKQYVPIWPAIFFQILLLICGYIFGTGWKRTSFGETTSIECHLSSNRLNWPRSLSPVAACSALSKLY